MQGETEPNCTYTSCNGPLMVHGFGVGVRLWKLFVFDLLGFGQSSRPHFPMDPALAEEQSVRSIEHWRQALALDRIILLGHSLGGYLATSYSIQYPERVSHLILVDPWGFQPMPVDSTSGSDRPGCPRWVEALIA
ncbi:unnamed protein product [Coregonus sp. 'balchen']|nr:unnamed protein product [Coregonus sp. 'balchen']